MQPITPTPSSRRKMVRRNHAFTLIEIMIVTLIIGILVSIALPNMTRARETARQKTCVANLRQIETAKELWAMDNHKASGDTVALSALVGVYITPNLPTGAPTSAPINLLCPTSGLPYEPTIGVIGDSPWCPTVSARTGPFAHILP